MTVVLLNRKGGIPDTLKAKMRGVYTQNSEVAALFGWTGNLFRLALTSAPATQQDFAVGYTTADILTFCSNNESNLRIVTRYDISGNGYNLSATSDANRPRLRRDPENDEWVCLFNLPRYKSVNTGTSGLDSLENALLPIPNVNDNLFAFDISINAHENSNSSIIASYPFAYQFDHLASATFSWYIGLTRGTAVAPAPATLAQIMGQMAPITELLPRRNALTEDTFPTWQYFRVTPSNVNSFVNRGLVCTRNITNKATTGFRQGRTLSAPNTINYTTLIGVGVTDAEIEIIKAAVCPKHGVPSTTPNRQIIISGDSISSGYNYIFSDEAFIYSWMYYLGRDNTSIRQNCLVRNRAIFGGHLNSTSAGATQFKEMLPVVDDRINFYYDATVFPSGQLVIVWLGTNDLASNRTGAAVHADLNSYCTSIRAKGYKVLVLDAIPRQPFTAPQEAERVAYNSLIAANWTSYADDFLQVSTLNWTPSGSYATYYQDGVHPNALGQTDLIVPNILPKIVSLLGL